MVVDRVFNSLLSRLLEGTVKTAEATILKIQVFNINGNGYRLVVAIDYRHQILFIKWIGADREYDRIDARTVSYGDYANSE